MHHVNLQADDSTQPGSDAAADTLSVINLYVSRVRSSMSWIKSPGLISRHAVYDCNSLVCAVGPSVAETAESVYSPSDVSCRALGSCSRRRSSLIAMWRAVQRLFMSAVSSNDQQPLAYCKCLHFQLHHPTSLCRHSMNATDVNIEGGVLPYDILKLILSE